MKGIHAPEPPSASAPAYYRIRVSAKPRPLRSPKIQTPRQTAPEAPYRRFHALMDNLLTKDIKDRLRAIWTAIFKAGRKIPGNDKKDCPRKYEDVIAAKMKERMKDGGGDKRSSAYKIGSDQMNRTDSEKVEPTTKRKELAKIAGTIVTAAISTDGTETARIIKRSRSGAVV